MKQIETRCNSDEYLPALAKERWNEIEEYLKKAQKDMKDEKQKFGVDNFNN